MLEKITKEQVYRNMIQRANEISKRAVEIMDQRTEKMVLHFTVVNDKRFLPLLGLSNEQLIKVCIDNINPADEESIKFYSYVYQNCELIPTWETLIAAE